jgi:hypothetical protein
MPKIWIGWAPLLALTVGCSRPALLASGPIDVDRSPHVVRFERPIPASGPRWELCFEFGRPGDSHKAGDIQAVLLTPSGRRQPFVDVELDRRGESVVCQIGRVDTGEEVVFASVELIAPGPVRLRGLRGGSAGSP